MRQSLFMKQKSNRLAAWIYNHAGLCIVVVALVFHLFIINDYGFTWDFHFHFFGGGKLLGIEPIALEPRNLPFVEPDPRNAWTLPYGAIMSIPPVASYLLLSHTLKLLPPDASYHLPIILWGVVGIAVTYAFCKEALNKTIAIIGSVCIALTPRYIGDLHNNMKDIPSAVMFAVNMWALWRLVKHKRFIDLILATAAFAIAFNVKVNSIFIPIIFTLWLITLSLRLHPLRIHIHHRFSLYFLSAPLAAFLLWWVFWPNPIGQLGHAFMTFGIGTNNIEVLLNGSWYCSGSTVPWYYPYWYLFITTPLPILIFFLTGLCVSVYSMKKPHVVHRELITLLLLWFFVPLTRYFIPTIGVIDGIRHFEEVLFPMAIFAGIGAHWVYLLLKTHFNRTILITLCSLPILYVFVINYQYHPYQITYFNEIVGGTKGAFGKYDLDYWGTSQKEAVLWVNAHAPKHAKVHIVMAAAVAGQYLRPDLVGNLNKYGYDESDFVILLNRQSFLYRFFYAYEYLLHHTPVHTIHVQGAPLTWIYDNRQNNKTERQTPWWKDEDPCIIKYWRGEHL